MRKRGLHPFKVKIRLTKYSSIPTEIKVCLQAFPHPVLSGEQSTTCEGAVSVRGSTTTVIHKKRYIQSR